MQISRKVLKIHTYMKVKSQSFILAITVIEHKFVIPYA